MKVGVLKAEKVPKLIVQPHQSQRICSCAECSLVLSKTQKKFCSNRCRNLVNSPGNKGGAPTKYRPEFAATKLREYLDDCERKNEPTLIPTNSSYIVLPNAKLPSKKGYARLLGVNIDSLQNWANQHYDFALAMDEIMDVQQEFLINNGLSGRYNAQLAKFMLGVNHGMVEKKEVETTHKMLGIVKDFYKHVDEIDRERYGSLL